MQKIIKVSPSAVVTTVTEQPVFINGLAFDSQGNLYFGVPSGFNVIEKLTPGGTLTTFAGGLQNPSVACFDPQGNLYAYTGQNSGYAVTKITPSGVESTFATDVSVYWDSAGDLYEGTVSGTVTLTTPSGSTTTIASGLDNPFPLAQSAQDELYVSTGGPAGEIYLLGNSGQPSPVLSAGPYPLAAVAVPEPAILPVAFLAALLTLCRRAATRPQARNGREP